MKTRLIAVLFALSATLTLQSCIENPPGEWQKPPRYGHGGTTTKKKTTSSKPSNTQSRNRFGYSGDDTAPPPSDTGTPGPTDRDRDVKPLVTDDSGDSGEKPAVEKPSGPPSAGDMPFAKGVPGDPLHVKLPGRADLPKISIEQVDAGGNSTGKPLPPGTPVSIPDPTNPGKEIYFKVP